MIFLGPDGIVGVQSCGQDFAAHERKILVDRAEEVTAWLQAGGKLVMIGWRKVKAKRGGKAMIWAPRVREIVPEDIHKSFCVGERDYSPPGTAGTEPAGHAGGGAYKETLMNVCHRADYPSFCVRLRLLSPSVD